MRESAHATTDRSRQRPLSWIGTGMAALAIALAMSTAGISVAAAASNPKLSNAPVPAMCGHAAGQLVDGKLHYGTHGDDYLLDSYSGAIAGGATAVAVIGCNAGGVSWPATLVFYRLNSDATPAIVGSYDLGRLRKSEHVDVHSAHIRDGRLSAILDSYEGAGCEIHKISASFHVKANSVIVSDVSKGPVLNHCPS